MVALRLETEPRAVAHDTAATDVFRNILLEVVAQGEAAGPTRHIATNPDGVANLLDAIRHYRDLAERGSEDDCRKALVYLLDRQAMLIREGVFSDCTPECSSFNERIREELAEAMPSGDDEILSTVRPIWQAFSSACQPKRCVIAGSVRRGRKKPKDLDIVCMPRRAADLFGAPREDYPELEAAIERLLISGQIKRDEELKRNGLKLKRFVLPTLDNMPLELYITHPDNFGAILAIRTGNPEFTHSFVTRRCAGGLMPNYLRMVEGELTRFDWKTEKVMETLSVPTEATFFERLGLPVLPPVERNEAGIMRLRALADQGEWARRQAVR